MSSPGSAASPQSGSRLEGVYFVSGYPIRPEVLPGHLKVGWSVAFREPVYVRPLRANALLKDRPWAKPLVPLINAGLDFCNSLARPRGRSTYGVEVLSREEFLADGGYEGFFAKWAAEQRNYLVKDRSFVAWRTGAPGATYRFVKLSVNGEWAGLAIVRSTNLKGVPALAVLDFMVPSGHVGGLEDLHHALVGLARREGREVVAAMMSPTRASAYRLARSLYLRTPAVFSVIFKALRSDLQQDGFGAEADWHLMWIDSDDL